MTLSNKLLATRLRTLRERRGWTRDELAKECAAIGEPGWTASVVLNVEGRLKGGSTHYRPVSPWELMVLARALGVAPVAILFPIGELDKVLVPGADGPTEVDPWTAAQWFTGELPYAADYDRVVKQRQDDGLDPFGGEGYQLNSPGLAVNYRNAERRSDLWREVAFLTRETQHLFEKAETPVARDMYRVVIRWLFERADRWHRLTRFEREAIKRGGGKVESIDESPDEYQQLRDFVESLGDDDA